MYGIKLMIVLCLCLTIVASGKKTIEQKILKKVKKLNGTMTNLAEDVTNLIEKADNNSDQLNNLVSSCGQISGIADGVAAVLQNTNMLLNKQMKPKSCQELLANGATDSGVYSIYLNENETPIKVFCDQTTDGGGWIVFQRREDGTVDFRRNWLDYKLGFGDPRGEVWLGLEYLHLLTKSGNFELRIDLEDWQGNTKYAQYSDFSIGGKSGNYVFNAANYSGTAGDAMKERHFGMPFSTKDRDHDIWHQNCANTFKAGWWYKNCHRANLNGVYFQGGNHASYADGVNWYQWKGYQYSLRFTEMKFRESV